MTPGNGIAPGFSLFEDDLAHVEKVVGPDWEHLHGAHVFITGGTGFFGQWLVESLLYASQKRSLGLRVTVLSRSPDSFAAGRGAHLVGRSEVRLLQGHVTTFDVPSDRITHIVHAASETNVDASDDWPTRFLEAALEGTRRILNLAAAHRVEALLVTSSGAVYNHADTVVDGRCVEGPAGSADLVGEKAIYGQGKRMIESMAAVAGAANGYRALIARCFAFVGPYLPLDSNYAIGNFIRDALRGSDILIMGDGTPRRSYLYAADLAAWLIVILCRGTAGRPYNVGGERAVSIGDLAQIVNRVAGSAGEVKVRKAPVGGAPVHTYLPSVERIREDLGLSVAIDLEHAVARTMAWHRARSSGQG